MWKYIKRKFDRWNLWSCHRCGCKETHSVPTDYINHMVSQEEIRCVNCDCLMNYWAYGYYEFPENKTEYMYKEWKWWRTIVNLKRKWNNSLQKKD